MPKTAVPKRPGPDRSPVYISDRNQLLAAALTAGYPTLDALANAVGVYRESLSKIANGHRPVTAQFEAKLREVLPDADKWLTSK